MSSSEATVRELVAKIKERYPSAEVWYERGEEQRAYTIFVLLWGNPTDVVEDLNSWWFNEVCQDSRCEGITLIPL